MSRYGMLVLFLLLAASTAPAQTLVVGPGAYTDLDSAFAAAPPGARILVQQDTTCTRLSGKGVTIVADGGRRRLDALASTTGQAPGIALVPAAQRLVMRGFDIAPVGGLAGGAAAFEIASCAGLVLLFDCTVDGNQTLQSDAQPTLLVRDWAMVHLHECAAYGRDAFRNGTCTAAGTDGITIDNSTVALQNSTFVGGDLGDPSTNGCTSAAAGAGVRATSSVVYLPYSHVQGGSTLSVPIDVRAVDSTVYGSLPIYLWASGGTYVNYSASPPLLLNGGNLLTPPRAPSRVTAQLGAIDATLTAAPASSSNVVLTAFGVGVPGWGTLQPFAEPLLLDPAFAVDVMVAPGGSVTLPIPASTMVLLRGATLGVTCVELFAGGELVLGTGAVLAF